MMYVSKEYKWLEELKKEELIHLLEMNITTKEGLKEQYEFMEASYRDTIKVYGKEKACSLYPCRDCKSIYHKVFGYGDLNE